MFLSLSLCLSVSVYLFLSLCLSHICACVHVRVREHTHTEQGYALIGGGTCSDQSSGTWPTGACLSSQCAQLH